MSSKNLKSGWGKPQQVFGQAWIEPDEVRPGSIGWILVQLGLNWVLAKGFQGLER